jgi:predicted negative regulator of RcsB-dependent stress response
MPAAEVGLPLRSATWPRFYLALIATAAVAACFLPLSDHLGYEFSELVALIAGACGGSPGICAAHTSRPASALRRAISFNLFSLLLPLGIVLLNGLRRPACDPFSALPLYALLTVPSAVLAACLGVVCGMLSSRRGGLLYGLVFFATLAFSLWPIAHGPQVFAFHHLGGMYPGPIYDEAIRPSRGLLFFRAATLLYAAALAGIALRSARGFVLAAVCGVAALTISARSMALHFRASDAQLDEELGGRLETEHLILHFPREKSPLERTLLVQDAEASVRGVLQFLGASAPARKIDVYLYRSAAEKRTLIGAADTSFTKPWLGQIHTNDRPAPHPILRHELVHALAAPIAHGPWGVPGRFFGLVPEMALVEGIAVAGDWPVGEFTVHQEARALLDLQLFPDLAELFSPGRFYAESGPRAYTAAGSFVRWFADARGASELRAVYAGARPFDVAGLSAAYLSFLRTIETPPRAVALASEKFAAPSITRRRCPHEVADLAQAARETRDPASAAALWEKCAALEPDDPGLLAQVYRSQLAAGDAGGAQATLDRALAHPKLSKPLAAQLLIEAGDAAWKAGNAPAARQRYESAAQLPQSEAAERALRVRFLALDAPATWAALRPLLAEADAGPQVLLSLRDLDLNRPRDGLFAYLLAKQLENHGDWEGAARYAQNAVARNLPGPLFVAEAQRMRGIAAWHLKDTSAARAAFTALGKDAPPGRAFEARRWLERL